MKLKVQAQSLQPGDIVGSGEIVNRVIINSILWQPDKVCVELYYTKKLTGATVGRSAYWGKYTMINVERPDKIIGNEATRAWLDEIEAREDAAITSCYPVNE